MAFAPGNKLAPGGTRAGAGRKSEALQVELKGLLDEAISRTARLSILEMIMHRAKAGDFKAAAFLFDRMYGKPVQHLEIQEGPEAAEVDLSRLTEDELKLLDALMRKARIETHDSGAGTGMLTLAAGDRCGSGEEEP